MDDSQTNTDNELILVKDRYKVYKVLGRGSYGEVWLVSPLESSANSKSKPRRCVLKRVSVGRSNDEKTDLAVAEREAQLLSSLKHPNIVSYIESFRSRDRHLNIVMAFCEGGDLYTKLKYRKKQLLGEEQILEWFIQITLALQYMHDRSILHRDLKTQNIFLTKHEIVKVGDLGIARILDNNGADLATTVIGTPYVYSARRRCVLPCRARIPLAIRYYMSPEIFSNQPYGQKSDIWSLGCCVYEMATLEHAFKAGDISSLVLKVVRGQTPTLPSADAYSKPLIELINTLLDKDADKRPTAKQILQYPYIKEHIIRLYDKTRQRCQPYLTASSSSSSLVVESSQNAEHQSHSTPPTPKPRASHLSLIEESNNEHSLSAMPSSSESRIRRRQQKTASNIPDVPVSPSPVATLVHDDAERAPATVNNAFIAKIRENDTLARFKRESSSPAASSQNDGTIASSSLILHSCPWWPLIFRQLDQPCQCQRSPASTRTPRSFCDHCTRRRRRSQSRRTVANTGVRSFHLERQSDRHHRTRTKGQARHRRFPTPARCHSLPASSTGVGRISRDALDVRSDDDGDGQIGRTARRTESQLPE